MWAMYDSTTVDAIPASANAVAGYVGGSWPTFETLVARWPHARHLSIAVNASQNAECLDIETGDAMPDDAPAWFHRQRARGVAKPVFYADAETMPIVIHVLETLGIKRAEYRVWDAHYTYVPHISVGSDATQWSDRALDRNLDESLCADSFFGVPPAPNPLDVLELPEREAVNSYDAYIKHPREHEHGLKITRERLVALRKAIWLEADHEIRAGKTPAAAWSFRNRAKRYRLLWARTA